MKVKELFIRCRNRCCGECQFTEECAVFYDRFDCTPDISPLSIELFRKKIDLLADHGNEELKKENYNE